MDVHTKHCLACSALRYGGKLLGPASVFWLAKDLLLHMQGLCSFLTVGWSVCALISVVSAYRPWQQGHQLMRPWSSSDEDGLRRHPDDR